MLDATELSNGLAHFYGTESYHRLSPMICRKLVCTDGVAYLAKNAGAFWLIDAIASHQRAAQKDPRLQEIQFWTLKRKQGNKFVLTCDRDEGDTAITQEIGFSDFPLDEIKIWIEPGQVGEDEVFVAMLPSER